MQHTINDLNFLKALVKEVHWNARGPGFLAIHAFLDDIYAKADEYVDEVAEHMVAIQLYGIPRWSSSDSLGFPEGDSLEADRSHVRTGLRIVAEVLGDVVSCAEEAIIDIEDDPAGEDILVRILQDFNKFLWLAHAELGRAHI